MYGIAAAYILYDSIIKGFTKKSPKIILSRWAKALATTQKRLRHCYGGRFAFHEVGDLLISGVLLCAQNQEGVALAELKKGYLKLQHKPVVRQKMYMAMVEAAIARLSDEHRHGRQGTSVTSTASLDGSILRFRPKIGEHNASGGVPSVQASHGYDSALPDAQGNSFVRLLRGFK